MRKLKGSMTVLMAMTLLALMGLIFTMAESVRVLAMARRNKVQTVRTTEDLFSMYVDKLWKEYGIGGIDGAGGGDRLDLARLEGHMADYLEGSVNPDSDRGTFLLRGTGTGCEIPSYSLLTDKGGIPFLKMAAEKEKTAFVGEAVDALKEKADDRAQQQKKADEYSVERELNKGADAIDQAAEEAEEAREKAKEEGAPPPPDPEPPPCENPIDTGKDLTAQGALAFYIPPEEKVYKGSDELSDMVSHRKLATGNLDLDISFTPAERVLTEQYLISHFSSYTKPLEKAKAKGLNYELEYILVGGGTDEANLNGVILRLMAFREAVNAAHIFSDGAKMQETYNLALSLAGASANPTLVFPIHMGIIAGWASVESALDVRTILSGEKVPAVKTTDNWTSSLYALPTYFEVHQKARSVKTGMGYEEYLRIMLTVEGTEKLAYRTMDMIERNLDRTPGYEKIRMDHLIWKADVSCRYREKPLFFSFVPDLRGQISLYEGAYMHRMSYLD